MGKADLNRILASGAEGSAILARGLAILELVRESGGETVKSLSERSDVPLATVYRLVKQLAAAGFIIEHQGTINPGPQLSPNPPNGLHLVDYARPVLTDLAARTQLAAILTVRVHNLALTLSAVSGKLARFASFVVGETHGLHAGASATPLLAFAPEGVREAILSSNLKSYTASTPNADGLRRKLELIRERGYEISHGEVQPQWGGVGIPALANDEAFCCLSLAAPDHLLGRQEERVLSELRDGVETLMFSIPMAARTVLWRPTNPLKEAHRGKND